MRNQFNVKFWLGICLAAFLAPATYGASCSYSISPTSTSRGNGTTNSTVTVSAGTNCAWSVTGLPSWITIQSGSSGTSTGTVAYTIAANLDSIGRTGVVTIAGLPFTVMQDGAPCNYGISPSSSSRGAGAVALANPITVSATTNCLWTVLNTNPWINIIGPTNGSGNGSVSYGFLANHTPVRRTGDVFIAEQTFELTQSPGSCQYEVFAFGTSQTNRLHGYGGSLGTNTVSIIPANGGCEWYVVNTNDWITITTNSAGTNGGTFSYNVAPNSNSWQRVGSLAVWDAIFSVVQNAAPCSNGYSILPSSATPGAEPETNVVSVTAIGGCPWTVSNTNSWISILSPTNNTNSGSITWAVAYNVASIGRTGVVVIAEKNFTVRQDPAICTYQISPPSRKHGYAAKATNTVSIDTLSICPWNVVNTNSWITFYAPTNGVGDSTNITYGILANPSASSRTGLVFIGGQSLVLTQLGVSCAIDLSPTNNPHGHGAASKTISVNTGTNCTWAVINTNSWIQITTNSSGTGSNAFSYAISPNPNSTPRTGYIYVEESAITVVQAGAPCNVPLTPTSATHTPLQETGTVVVASPGGCNWSATTINPWVTILSGATGTGIDVVTYRVSANANGGARSGGITVAGQIDTNYFSIDQDGVTCAYRLSPTNRSHGPGAVPVATFKVLVSNACPWVVQNNNTWIQITTNSSGSGSNQVSYSVDANSLPSERIGALVVQGQSLIITQKGITCNYKLSATNRPQGFGANTNSVNVTNVTAGCSWTATTSTEWLTLLGASSGIGNGTVTYSFTANSGTTPRTGTIMVEDQVLTITQGIATNGFAFEAVIPGPAGEILLKLNGGPPGIWELQTSSNLLSWAKLTNLTNTTGRVEYTAPSAPYNRFFRAVIP